MAENESLDLRNPGGKRWLDVVDGIKKKQSPEIVAHKASRKLIAALRKAFKEFLDAGISFEQLVAARNDIKSLARLIRKCQGHEYAHLFEQIAVSEPSADEKQLITLFLNGVIDRVGDQITQELAGTGSWPEIPALHDFLLLMRRAMEPEVQRVAAKLAKNPNWSPTVRKRKHEDVVNPTQDLLSVSLLGMNKK